MGSKDHKPIEFNKTFDDMIKQLENLTKRVERLEVDKRTLQQQVNRLLQAQHHNNQSMY